METENKILIELAKIKTLTLIGVKNVLTTAEVSELTGLTKSYVYKLCMEKKIPYYKGNGGKFTYFDKKEVENWMLETRISTFEELNNKAVNRIVNK